MTGTKNADAGFSYLEFGAIDPQQGTKELHDFRTHGKAYDWLMHARYSNDLMAYYKMISLHDEKRWAEIGALYWDEVHHPEDFWLNIQKLVGLSLFDKPSFFELGSARVAGCAGRSQC